MVIYNSNYNNQPAQAIPTIDKNEDWQKENMDWIETYLESNLPEKRKRLLKNYSIMQGIIDPNDYSRASSFIEDFKAVDEALEEEILSSMEFDTDSIHNYPLITPIVNLLTGELSEKFDHIKVKAIDPDSINDYYEHKKSMFVDYIKYKEFEKVQDKVDLSQLKNEQDFQKILDEIGNEKLSLPHIQKYLNRTYQSSFERWAIKVQEEIKLRFNFSEKEIESFKHMLASDEAYWEIILKEDDIDVELWNPIDTLTIMPTGSKYTTDASLVCRQYKTTVAGVVAKYGNKISNEILEGYTGNSEEANRKEFRDDPFGLKSNEPGDYESNDLPFRKLAYAKYRLNNIELNSDNEVTVTEGYWVSYRQWAKVKRIVEGNIIEDIEDPSLHVYVEKPKYDENDNLISGEEVELFYAPEIYHGTKLNFNIYGNTANIKDTNDYLKESLKGKNSKYKKGENLGELYIDVKPLEYQFSDKYNLYKPMIPVAGCDGFEPQMNVGKYSFIDRTGRFQVLFNAAMNQIDHFMQTEIGLFYVLDQKLVPRNSIDGSWGSGNWLKFLLTAKEEQVGVIDSSPSNTQNGSANFGLNNVVNMLKTEQFRSRMELAESFKRMLFEAVGVNLQRMGTVTSQETATGVEVAVNNSYAQTKMYFQNHTDLLMKVYDVALEAMKYIESKKPESRVNFINSEGDQVLFEVETDNLLLKRFNIFLLSTPNYTKIVEDFKQLAIQNNTAGATILDFANILEFNNMRDIKDVLAAALKRTEEQAMAQQQAAAEENEKARQHEMQLKKADQEFEASENDKDRYVDMYTAEVNSIGRSQNSDLNANAVNDALEIAKFNAENNKNYNEMLYADVEARRKDKELDFKIKEAEIARQKEQFSKAAELSIKEKEIKRDYANMRNDLQIARENAKNRNKRK